MQDSNDPKRFYDENGDDFDEEGFKGKAKRFFFKSKEGARNVSSTVKQSLTNEGNQKAYASLAYFPILGPLLAFLFKRRQELTIQHAYNASYLQIGFLVLWLALWLLEHLPVVSHLLKFIYFVPFITDAMMYLNVVGLVGFSIYGIVRAQSLQEYKTPFLYELANNLIRRKGNIGKVTPTRPPEDS